MANLTKKQLNEQVNIICYNQQETMTRKEGIEKYLEGVCCCEGSERDRYLNIYLDLIEGKMTASDL